VPPVKWERERFTFIDAGEPAIDLGQGIADPAGQVACFLPEKKFHPFRPAGSLYHPSLPVDGISLERFPLLHADQITHLFQVEINSGLVIFGFFFQTHAGNPRPWRSYRSGGRKKELGTKTSHLIFKHMDQLVHFRIRGFQPDIFKEFQGGWEPGFRVEVGLVFQVKTGQPEPGIEVQPVERDRILNVQCTFPYGSQVGKGFVWKDLTFRIVPYFGIPGFKKMQNQSSAGFDLPVVGKEDIQVVVPSKIPDPASEVIIETRFEGFVPVVIFIQETVFRERKPGIQNQLRRKSVFPAGGGQEITPAVALVRADPWRKQFVTVV